MRDAPSPGPESTSRNRLQRYWQAEALRLREVHWGPLEDQAACHHALQSAATLPGRILARADWLSQDRDLPRHLAVWAGSARWALLCLCIAALLSGVLAASGALNHGRAQVNLALALLALLGLHTLSFLLWAASYLPGVRGTGLLSRLWLWLTKRLARGPDQALLAQAFISLLQRTRAWRCTMGVMTHGIWTAAFAGALPTLLILLSTRRYTFHWETTLLSPDAFATITQALGTLPRALGFPVPDGAAVAASLGQAPTSAAMQADWSIWLVACVLCWGLLPRILALTGCLLALRRRMRDMTIDPGLPGWLELRDRLHPGHSTLGIDAPADESVRPPPAEFSGAVAAPGRTAIVAHELGPDLPWPPGALPENIMDLGTSDSREDRARLRTELHPPPARLLVACDARLTPDRGTLTWLKELRRTVPRLDIALLGSPGREALWRDMVEPLGLTPVADPHAWLMDGAHPSISRPAGGSPI